MVFNFHQNKDYVASWIKYVGWLILSHVMNSHGSYPNMKIFMVLGGVGREWWIGGSNDHANFCGWR